MKALMFGWEFPPHILGGLGTASFGLTRGMAMQPDMDITFCIGLSVFCLVSSEAPHENHTVVNGFYPHYITNGSLSSRSDDK